jgi:hypothetical protein
VTISFANGGAVQNVPAGGKARSGPVDGAAGQTYSVVSETCLDPAPGACGGGVKSTAPNCKITM